jgi:arylsulfatase A-like enzyme
MAGNQPNFLFVSVDSLRPDYCSFVNDDERTTPFLDRLSDESTAAVFEKAITPSTWTLQVHGSLFTGLYPPEHGVLDKGRSLGDHPTLATLLNESSYTVESFGRNGWLESGDILRGFTHHHTRYSQHIRKELVTFREGLKERDWETATDGAKWSVLSVLEKLRKRAFRHKIEDALTIDNAVDRLGTVESPFCFFVHLNGAHYVYRPRAPDHRRFGDHSLQHLVWNVQYQREMIDGRPQIYSGEFEFDETQNRITADLYRGAIYQTDTLLERLVSMLQRSDVFDDTVIVVFGDHGDHLGDDGHFGHQFSVDDVLVRVPLLIVDPTGSIPDNRSNEIVQLNDLYPTTLSMAGIDPPETRSVDLTDGSRDAGYVYYSAPESVIDRFESYSDVSIGSFPPARQYAVWQSPERKAIWYPDEDSYDGPAADDTEFREMIRDHETSLSPVIAGAGEAMSRDVEKNLQQLGYL